MFLKLDRWMWIVIFALLIGVPELIAQGDSTVGIVLSNQNASLGDLIFADIVIRSSAVVGGADVGVEVDATCLRIESRDIGTYLPSTAENGGFSPFSEQTESTTRFSAAITDRAKAATGEGVFYRVGLRVLCDAGNIPIRVTYAQLAFIANPDDPSSAAVSGVSLESGGLHVVDTTVNLFPSIAQTQEMEPSAVPISTETAPLTPEPETTLSPETDMTTETSDPLLYIGIGLVLFAVIGLIAVNLVYRRRTARRK